MWGWLSEIVKGLVFVLKALFGFDKPAETEVKREESPGLRRPGTADCPIRTELPLPQ